ncbi:alpha/beta hydrolase, partial [Trichocoleus sp. FACHB-591]|uniref:alpha/beta fold hydrolase n=1 Tax=Trichocoleus sp. FACHB-591 TaxID=2692872 RepID=UPI0016852571
MLWLAVLLGVLIGVIGFGAIYQTLATRRDRHRFLPPGKLIEIEGSHWHYQIVGDGSPTVIVDSGAGGTHLDWQLVQPEVAKFTRVLTYDRAGYGWSDLSSEPRTAEQVVSELRQLLQKAEIEPPYVLVGMSLSGLFSRFFAYHYPEEVAGMVLVDVAHERMYEETPVEWVELNKRLEGLLTQILHQGLKGGRKGVKLIDRKNNGHSCPRPRTNLSLARWDADSLPTSKPASFA